jgi:hypothetical protein
MPDSTEKGERAEAESEYVFVEDDSASDSDDVMMEL